MSNELMVAHCPECGNVFQKNPRNLCASCATIVDQQMQSIERYLLRNRMATTEDLAQATTLSPQRIRAWIRKGKLSIFDYPNMTDQCDLCASPIRRGHLCTPCSTKIKDDIARTLEREQKMKERLRAAHSYIVKN
ncbi:hypothetical protein [Cohnella cholangitidis]|uniref:Flagellar protein n=1 Tax=Cohnella cholangitidis TaxID=2598458 RepID=A0A7G5BTS2_9BACL|nr:hypothetical protein [Cohnella cholangitidis]QMV40356.1 hypothetical protein FPL14_03430 [Cohnella cholangitidis]